jgi:hypothetical protein
VLGLLLAATLACGRSDQSLEATVDAVNTAVELTLAAMTPAGPGAPTLPPAATPTPEAPATEAPATAAPIPSDTPSAPATEPSGPDPTPNAPARPNGSVLTADRRDAPPNIDGNQDDWPSTLPYTIDQNVFGQTSWQGTSDQSANFNAMWDDGNLYLYIVVNDDVHVQNDAGVTLYRGDSLELQLDADLAGDFDEASLNGDDYQIGLSPGASRQSPEYYWWNPAERRGQPTGIVMATRPTGDNGGYIAELAIPWSLFGVSPAEGSRFGFALNSSDNDSPGTTEQQSMISSVITRRLLDPTTWGTLELVIGN